MSTAIPLSFRTASQDEKDHALIGAASFGNIAVATHLLDAGASVRASKASGWADGHRMTALNTAASRGDPRTLDGRIAILERLLERGGSAFTQDEKDKALFVAIVASPRQVEALLRHGADPSARRADGQNTLHVAVSAHGDPAILTRLIDAGADLDERDADNNAPLRLAVEIGRTDAVRLLLDRGADAMVTHTPDLHIAQLCEPCTDLWRLLVLNPRTGSFRQRFEQAVAAGDSATLIDLLAQRTPEDDVSGGIPAVLDNAYMHTSGQRSSGRTVSPSNRWAEARRCVRALLKAGAQDSMIADHHDSGRRFTIPAWFEHVRPAITTGKSQFERTARTITSMVVRDAQRGLREAIDESNGTTEARKVRARL